MIMKLGVSPSMFQQINLDKLDSIIANFMQRWALLAMRISFAIIFIWFGILKPLGISAAGPLVMDTVKWMPVFESSTWLNIIGWWEVVIGLAFLTKRTTRIAIGLLALQMMGTFMPLIILPETTFQAGHFPYAPTLEGQYIIKNLLIISAALFVGSTVKTKSES
ncbi:MAG: hypothetical protein ACSHX0_03320 [Akkermansiaceae bacterium]